MGRQSHEGFRSGLLSAKQEEHALAWAYQKASDEVLVQPPATLTATEAD
jgi:hypothetical protein